MAHENDGHRARLRERMLKEGLSSFQDHEVLEMLLFQYLPRHDTNKIAHRLLDKFGSFSAIFDASPDKLMMVDGISKVTACNIAMLKEVWLRYKQGASTKIELNSLASIIKYAQLLIADSYTEKMVVVYVDHSTNFVYKEEYSSNSADSIDIDVKKIVITATRTNAAGVLLFHCHPKGVCTPSDADVVFTEKMYFTLASINIMLLEHIIFNANGDYYSFYKEGLISDISEKYYKAFNKEV